MNAILYLDSWITDFFSHLLPHNSFFETIFTFFSLKGNYFFIWAIIFIFLFIFEEKRNLKFLFVFLISIVLTLGLVDYVFKPLFHRDRPYVVRKVDAPYCPRSYSFPSGHAAGAFAGAVALSIFDKRRHNYYYFGAALISYSRVYLECHYLLDVIVGALFGCLVTYAVYRLVTYNTHYSKAKRS